MIRTIIKKQALLLWGALFACLPSSSFAQTDTLRVMAYNVLYYGDRPACQGPHNLYHNYLKTIVSYSNPDIIGLEKMAAIPAYAGDMSGSAPAGFGDSILAYALNAAFANRYAYCPFSNTSGADNISMLFYDKSKLGYLSTVSSYVNITDFNTYKLYYKAADLATTHDTVFLYITLNHDNSGSASSDASVRAGQIAGEMAQIETHFSTLPNMLNMGDFNTHNSSEACYQTLVSPVNPAFRFYDPPFYPDAAVTYPADWDNNPSTYANFLTTTTRLSGSAPNSCGTSGGGKSWYDHIFVSASIINHTNGISYVPHSYRTTGNDGNRVGISINDAPTNTAAPSSVIEALYQMSNKYPIMVDLVVSPGVTAVRDAAVTAGVNITNPIRDYLEITLPEEWAGKSVNADCTDMTGREVMHFTLAPTTGTQHIPCSLAAGAYTIRFTTDQRLQHRQIIIKD